MTEKEVVIKNLKIYYKVFGEGKPFLILHGWGSNSNRWNMVAEILGKQYLVIVPDLPGFGKSQILPTAWSLDNYVEWLFDFSQAIPELRDAFNLIGHSFGGALAAKFSIKYTQRVEKLFLVSAACIRKNTAIKKVLYKVSKVIKIFSFLPYYTQFKKAVYKFIIRKSDYLNQEGVMKETYLRVILDDLSFKLGFIKIPTVIIWGDKDELTPIEDSYLINKKIRNSKIVFITGVGHDLNRHEHPEILSEKILGNLGVWDSNRIN